MPDVNWGDGKYAGLIVVTDTIQRGLPYENRAILRFLDRIPVYQSKLNQYPEEALLYLK